MILFATKWGLDFHGLYHIVLCCTRLQSEVGGRGQSEREGVYICLVCGLMAPYVCEEKWQPEVGCERRPTTPPRSRSARHHPSFRFMPQTYLPSMNAVLPSLTGDVLSVSTHKVDRVKASATLWISLTLQPFLYPCVTNVLMLWANSNEYCCYLEIISSLLDHSGIWDKNVVFLTSVIVTAHLF